MLTALASAGAKNSNVGYIDFIRLKRNGKTEKRRLRYNLSSIKGSSGNPILIDGDIIIVRKNKEEAQRHLWARPPDPFFCQTANGGHCMSLVILGFM